MLAIESVFVLNLLFNLILFWNFRCREEVLPTASFITDYVIFIFFLYFIIKKWREMKLIERFSFDLLEYVFMIFVCFFHFFGSSSQECFLRALLMLWWSLSFDYYPRTLFAFSLKFYSFSGKVLIIKKHTFFEKDFITQIWISRNFNFCPVNFV